jgi:branched-chain amino acid transport system ATP-binding protein
MVLLKTEDLTCKFGGLTAVDSFNYILNKGELASIIGPNGAGKSTLFKALVGTVSPTSGRILFEEDDITSVPPYERLKRGLAKAHQITQIFPKLTVIENMAIAAQYRLKKGYAWFYLEKWNDEETVRRSLELLARISLDDRKDVLAGSLPQGDKKRLEIGMAMATDPTLLLLDEPTAGSSPVETRITVDLIEALSKSLTIIVVEHKMDIVMNLARRITVMHRGKLIADGTPDEIRANKFVREIYLGETDS